jgi:enoyl-CoA hydratase/carnithine racemase
MRFKPKGGKMGITPRFHEIEKEGPVVIWKFSNPPRNLATLETGEELGQLVEEFDKDPDLRVGVVTSAVPGMFIQHFDVSTIVDWADMLNKASKEEFEQMMAGMPSPRGIAELTEKPLICAMNGPVEGGGCELAMHCDFRFMARDTFMGQPEVTAGFPPGYGIPRMTQLIGLGRTLELCMTGRRVYPDEAERIGLVTRVCDPEDLMPEVMKFATLLAEKPQLGLSLVKKTVYDASDKTFQEGVALNYRLFLEAIRGDEALQIMKAYVAAGQDREKMLEMLEELAKAQGSDQ